MEELEHDKVEAERRERDLAIDMVRTEIENMVRDEYEQRWEEVQNRLSPAGKRLLEEAGNHSDEEDIEEEDHV
jgi:hypothetical protein